ncbi:MAG: NUDIX hydrolase [Actinomycetota bacterium]|nr:NUDIX hydrolase [Actinomycetota bacterium]
MPFERIASETAWEGKMIALRVERFRFDDGSEATREVVSHPGAVAIVAHDGERLYLVRQPREAVGEESLLEVPAGKLDEGESPLESARRELAEELGKEADAWTRLTSFYSTPGFTDERMHLFLATDLRDLQPTEGEGPAAAEEERLEVVPVPLEHIDAVIAECEDAKSLVGLLWLRAYGPDRPQTGNPRER